MKLLHQTKYILAYPGLTRVFFVAFLSIQLTTSPGLRYLQRGLPNMFFGGYRYEIERGVCEYEITLRFKKSGHISLCRLEFKVRVVLHDLLL